MLKLTFSVFHSMAAALSHLRVSGDFSYFLFTFCWPLLTISFSWTRERQDSQGDTVVLCVFVPVILVGNQDWLPNQSCDLTFLCWPLGKKFAVVRRTHLYFIGGVIPVSPDKGRWRLPCVDPESQRMGNLPPVVSLLLLSNLLSDACILPPGNMRPLRDLCLAFGV